jgi:hypothetical protein
MAPTPKRGIGPALFLAVVVPQRFPIGGKLPLHEGTVSSEAALVRAQQPVGDGIGRENGGAERLDNALRRQGIEAGDCIAHGDQTGMSLAFQTTGTRRPKPGRSERPARADEGSDMSCFAEARHPVIETGHP